MTRDFIKAWFILSRREYYADFFITPPITALYAWWTFTHAAPRNLGAGMVLFGAGWSLWTLYEYALHRFILHDGPAIMRLIHGLHHAKQDSYVAIHPVGTILLYLLSYALFGVHGSVLMIGFYCGYIAYSTFHTMLHFQQAACDKFFPALLHHHRMHHRLAHTNFGVITRFWDRFFGTIATP